MTNKNDTVYPSMAARGITIRDQLAKDIYTAMMLKEWSPLPQRHNELATEAFDMADVFMQVRDERMTPGSGGKG